MNEYQVSVTEVIQRTATCLSIRAQAPDGLSYQPGQWALVTPVPDNGSGTKPLSFSSSPTEPYVEFTKRLSGSNFSRGLRSLKVGDPIVFKGPNGDLVYREDLDQVVFVAGGIGITPVRSIIRYIHDSGRGGAFRLLYANKSLDDVPFREELEGMADNGGIEMTYVLEEPPQGWRGPTGFITSRIIRDEVPDPADQNWYLCGPPPMVDCLEQALESLDIPAAQVFKEKLAGYTTMT